MQSILPAVKQVFIFDAKQPSSLLPFLDLKRGDEAPPAAR
jgi:hypothetical protein